MGLLALGVLALAEAAQLRREVAPNLTAQALEAQDQRARDYWHKAGFVTGEPHSTEGLNPCVAEDLAALLRQRGWASAADYGAGSGAYAHELKRLGISQVVCYDWKQSVAKKSNGLCSVHDLTAAPLPAADLVFALDVGAHIPADLEPKFLDNLGRGAAHAVVLSWALPGPGDGHVNSQSSEHVAQAMRARGFEQDQVASSLLRSHAKKQCPTAPNTDHFAQTLMVFFRGSPDGLFPAHR